MGGSKRDDRIEVKGEIQNACVHKRCNTEKGSRRIPYLYQVQPCPPKPQVPGAER
jgi:hypothetical protein